MSVVQPGILFTAFERSGDEHAAPVIAALRALRPELPIHGLGGPAMRRAGATLLEESTHKPAMFADALLQAWTHHQRVGRLKHWLRENRIAALVPVDSPAANWAICKAVRRTQPEAKIVHLVAPQLWAWASWRIGRMKRLSDHVLCLLPFEKAWFETRGMPATFVGHPLFDRPLPAAPGTADAEMPGGMRLALFPGSRSAERRRNWPTMLEVLAELLPRYPQLSVTVAALHDDDAQRLAAVARDRLEPVVGSALEARLRLVVGRSEEVLDGADVVLTKSGTSTLQVLSRRKPMVVFHNVVRWQWELVGRWVIHTRTFSLPNLLGEAAGMGRIVPEYVPHFGAAAPLVREVERLLTEPAARARQRESFAAVAAPYAGKAYADEAATRILALAGL